MKIEVHTKISAETLLTKIKKDITDKKIKTWSIVQSSAGDDFFTHNPEQWFKKALLRPSTAGGPIRLILTVDWFTNSVPSEYTKGLFIGRFTEELLEHYIQDFSKLEIFA